jgi:formate hydrogenlyase subunit 6/NADH:ubiquinone oxidoreductase subunit I
MPGRTVKLTAPDRTAAVQSYVLETGKGLGITLGHFFKNWPSRVPWTGVGVVALLAAACGVALAFGMKSFSGRMTSGFTGLLVMFGGVPAGLGLLALGAGAYRKFRATPAETYLRLVPYPDVPADYYPPRYRGEHRLMHREDGSVRCVSCMMCSTVCPADCINIVAGNAADPPSDSEKVPGVDAEKFPVRFEIDELRCVVCGFCVEACPCDAIRMDSSVHVTAYADRRDFVFDRNRLMERGEQSQAVQGGHGPGWRKLS